MADLTVCIATYNRWEMCRDALKSVLSQAGITQNVIIVDDSSGQPVPSDIEYLIDHDDRVHAIRHEANRGLAAARNSAIFQASGTYFTFCDDDDKWPPGHAVGLVETALSSPPDVGIVLSLSRDSRESYRGFFDSYPTLQDVMKAGITPPVGSQLYDTSLIRQIGGYDARVRSGVDHDLWVSLSALNPRVAVSWGEPVTVGKEPGRERMTNAEAKRRAGLQQAMTIWKPKLIDVFGEPFYVHFALSYAEYLDFRFFYEDIRERRLWLAAYRVVHKPKLFLISIKRVGSRLTGLGRGNLFPPFHG